MFNYMKLQTDFLLGLPARLFLFLLKQETKDYTQLIKKLMQEAFEITPLQDWLPTGNFPLVIAGPCSAESEEQVLSTARELAKIPQVKIFRAGLWKPRTRPSSFEGVGNRGLRWLEKVKAETGLLTTVEVANPQHVEAALSHGIDICQLLLSGAFGGMQQH